MKLSVSKNDQVLKDSDLSERLLPKEHFALGACKADRWRADRRKRRAEIFGYKFGTAGSIAAADSND